MNEEYEWINDCILKCERCGNTVRCYFLDGHGETRFCPNCGADELVETDIED